MHERSLVAALLKQVETIRRREGAGAVREVRLEIGPLSGVEPLLVESAFRELVRGTAVVDAQLLIDDVPLTGRCRSCDAAITIEHFRFHCPDCGSSSVQVTGGDEVRLLSVSIEDAEAMS